MSTVGIMVVAQLLDLRSQGLTLARTAEELERTGAPTAQGGRWTARTVKLIEDKHRKGVSA